MRILCVDDDPIILELLSEVLRVLDLTNVDFCLSANEALEKIHNTPVPFDCFLLDIQMPGLDGIELLSLIRTNLDYTRTPIIMITTITDRASIDRAFAAGATDYITKPFELGEVHARLRSIEAVVIERKHKEDRNPVPLAGRSLSIFAPADMSEMLGIVDINGFIQYVAIENYLLKLPRTSLFGMRAVGVIVPNLERAFYGGSAYDYKATVTGYAKAISDSLSPNKFFGAHAGGQSFIFVLERGNDFDHQRFEVALNNVLENMEFCRSDGRPLSLPAVVGEPVALQLSTQKNVKCPLANALRNAKLRSMSTNDLQVSGAEVQCQNN